MAFIIQAANSLPVSSPSCEYISTVGLRCSLYVYMSADLSMYRFWNLHVTGPPTLESFPNFVQPPVPVGHEHCFAYSNTKLYSQLGGRVPSLLFLATLRSTGSRVIPMLTHQIRRFAAMFSDLLRYVWTNDRQLGPSTLLSLLQTGDIRVEAHV